MYCKDLNIDKCNFCQYAEQWKDTDLKPRSPIKSNNGYHNQSLCCLLNLIYMEFFAATSKKDVLIKLLYEGFYYDTECKNKEDTGVVYKYVSAIIKDKYKELEHLLLLV